MNILDLLQEWQQFMQRMKYLNGRSGKSFKFEKLVPNNQEESHLDWPKKPCDQAREYYKKWQKNETSVT